MKIKRILAIVIGICMLLMAINLPVFSDEPPEGFDSWDDYYNYLVYGEVTEEEATDLKDMTLVGSNDRFKMYYNESGADVYLEDIKSGKIWGSALYGDYIDTSDIAPNASTNLLTVSYSDKQNNISELDLTSSSCDGFSVESEIGDDCVTLSVDMPEIEISFEVELSLVGDGLKVNIPFKSLKEKECKLLSIKLLPAMGAAKPGEDGYVFYPDGSGALMEIADYKKGNPEFYNYPIYYTDKADFDLFDNNEALDIKGLMLPVFGIKHTKGGVFAEISAGGAASSLHIAVNSFYQSYFELNYRTCNTVSYQFTSSKGEITKIGRDNMKGDRTVIYHILEDNDNTYSSMANLYRNLLIDRGELKKTEETNGVPLSVEFFMGIQKSGIIGDTIQTLTSFEDAENIVKDLRKNGVENLDVMLKGWCDGGYDTLPTSPDAESALGGKSELDSLAETVKKGKGDIYLYSDFINADNEKGSFNAEKYALKNDIDTVVTDSDGRRHLLDPKLYMPKATKELISEQENALICFGNAGKWLISNNGEKVRSNRAEIIASINDSLKIAAGKGSVAVTGGNKYIWKNADRLYDIPDNDSGYYQNDKTVPFYQMLVHGYKEYTSLAANLSYDYKYQKLRFVETGSIPHFIITENSPNLLKGTSFDGIFSSEYKNWKSVIKEMWTDMNNRLGDVWNLTIEEHSYITDSLVQIVYSDSSKVYINYSQEEVKVENTVVPAMDYILVKGS